MDEETRTHAEARLREATAAAGLLDPRDRFRERLKQLRQSDPDGFRRAVQYYEQHVLPGLAGGDPLLTWLEYGSFLGQLTSNGRLTCIDETGRALPFTQPLQPRALVLFIPEDTAVDALVAAEPLQPSAAQQATLDLLVHRKLAL
jgi:hypothetical protein